MTLRSRLLLSSLLALGLPLYAFACTDSDPPAATSATSTPEGGASPPPSSGDSGPSGGSCSDIASACHPYDLGPGKQHDCHELAEDPAQASRCAAESTACLAACSPANGPLDVTIKFGAFVGTEPFACGTKYDGLGAEASRAEPIDLRFYVMDLKLIDDAGNDAPVSLVADGAFQNEHVALLDFEDKSGACDNGTTQKNDVVRGKVPFGRYRGLAFTVGVPEEVNHTDVATAETPLNLTGLNWDWLMGRIFFASGFRAEKDDAGATNSHFVHLGAAGCTGDPADGGAATCTKSNRPTFRFAAFRPVANVVALDVRELVKAQKLATVMHGCHGDSEANCASAYGTLGLDFATGDASSSAQTAFTVK